MENESYQETNKPPFESSAFRIPINDVLEFIGEILSYGATHITIKKEGEKTIINGSNEFDPYNELIIESHNQILKSEHVSNGIKSWLDVDKF